MCDVCTAEGIDTKFVNGNKVSSGKSYLYKVYQGRVAAVNLCKLHDIQLFVLGESRFLQEHIILAKVLVEKQMKVA